MTALRTPALTPCLWFDTQAEEAARFYTGIFPESQVRDVSRLPEGAPGPAGGVVVVAFTLAGRAFQAFNGGPAFTFTPAISISVDCADQAEVDRYWDALLEGGGQPSQCGWLTDRFGLSWQVVPQALPRLLADPDPAKAGRVLQAMLGMVKLDVAALERAAAAS